MKTNVVDIIILYDGDLNMQFQYNSDVLKHVIMILLLCWYISILHRVV